MPVAVHKLLQGSAIFQRVHAGKGIRPRVLRKFNPNHGKGHWSEQPRVPAGSPEGGEWIGEGSLHVGHVSSESDLKGLFRASQDYASERRPFIESLGNPDDTSRVTWTRNPEAGVTYDFRNGPYHGSLQRGTVAGDLRDYTDESGAINGVLRGNRPSVDPIAQRLQEEKIRNIDAGFRMSAPTAKAMAVVRLMPRGVVESLEPGTVFEDLAFVSTSRKRNFGNTQGPTGLTVTDYSRIIIHLPVGSKVLPIESVSEFKNQAEILLNRGSRFRVLSNENGVVEMELLR